MFKYNHKRFLATLAIGAASVFVLSSYGMAQVPYLINYQGRLTDDLGDPVPDGEYEATFRIWSDSTNDSPTYQEWISPNQTILVLGGLFNYQLGSNEALPPWIIVNDTALWLGIKIGADPEIAPRARLTSVPYAYKAWKAEYSGYADSAGFALSGGGGGGWVDDGSVVRLETSSDQVGIGTSSPANRLHIVGSESSPLLYVEKTGSGRGLKVSTVSACAIWVSIRTDNQLISTVTTGTAPLAVNSETKVTNLNADMLDGEHASEFAGITHTHPEKKACADMYEGSTNASSQITITFPVTFDTAPYISVTGYIMSGAHSGKMAYIQEPIPTTSSVTVTIQYWSGAIFMDVGNSVEVQLSYTAIEK
jgi:hypothetical protein